MSPKAKLVLPLISVSAAILGVVGLALGSVMLAKDPGSHQGIGFVGLGILFVCASSLEIIVSLRRRIRIEDTGVVLGGSLVPWERIVGIEPPMGRKNGVGIVLHDRPLWWSPLDTRELYTALEQRLESHWGNTWERQFEESDTLIYQTSLLKGNNLLAQLIVMTIAAPLLWLFSPWFGILVLAFVAFVGSDLMRRMWMVPVKVMVSPRELMFQYRNRVNVYAWNDIEEIQPPDAPYGPFAVIFNDGRSIMAPRERPFYHAMLAYLMSRHSDKVVPGEEE